MRLRAHAQQRRVANFSDQFLLFQSSFVRFDFISRVAEALHRNRADVLQ